MLRIACAKSRVDKIQYIQILPRRLTNLPDRWLANAPGKRDSPSVIVASYSPRSEPLLQTLADLLLKLLGGDPSFVQLNMGILPLICVIFLGH